MNIEYVELQEIEEPITIDHTVETKFEKPKNPVEQSFNLNSIPKIKHRYRPIEKKIRTNPIKLNVPVQMATFATLEDYLAAINA